MKEPTPQNNSKVPDKNKILSPNKKLKEMQAFINSLQSKKKYQKKHQKLQKGNKRNNEKNYQYC